MPSVAVPVALMVGMGAGAGAFAHVRNSNFWRSTVVGGLAASTCWIAGALMLVVPTEGLGWTGLGSLWSLAEAFVIVSAITLTAAAAVGLLLRWKRVAHLLLPKRAAG